jgi:hypothetical protein
MINLITDKSSERLKYIIEVIFKTVLNTPYTLINLSEQKEPVFLPGDAILNYSSASIPGSFKIPVAGLLFEETINDHQPEIIKGSIPKLFPYVGNGYDLDYDIFSASFYLITEYEKYCKHIVDLHGRYQEDAYFSFSSGLYKEPMVNIYAEDLWQKLSVKYSQLERLENKFDFEITIDVDHPWAYLNKGLITYAGFFMDMLKLNFQNFSRRYNSLKSGRDPYDSFEWLSKICPQKKTGFFFLLGNESKYDSYFSYSVPEYRKLIKKTADLGFSCGLHPSYNSFLSASIIKSQKKSLEEIIERDVIFSRQHYLRYKLPETNRALIEAGIKHDYTTAMVHGIGFRNGIANEFNWFDAEKNEKTDLILHPTMAMDVSLKNYLGYDAEYAFNMLLDLAEKTRKVNGKFVLLWHNSNLSELAGWNDWKGLFSELIKYLDSKTV